MKKDPRSLRPRKAAVSNLRPNLLIFGESGAGKTLTALQLAKLTGARCLVIDGENGTDDYVDQFDFDVIQTDHPPELEAQLDYYLENPDGYTMLVVDPISVFHLQMENMADDEIRPGKKGVGRFTSVLDPGTRAIIKRLNKTIAAKMRRLDMALVVTARAKPKYEAITRGGKLVSLEKKGITWEGDNGLNYEFRHVVELVTVGRRRIGRWDKTRGVDFKDIEADDPLSFAGKLLEMISPKGFTEKSEPRPVATEEQAERIRELAKDLPTGVMAKTLAKAGASTIEDLPREIADSIIKSLESKK